MNTGTAEAGTAVDELLHPCGCALQLRQPISFLIAHPLDGHLARRRFGVAAAASSGPIHTFEVSCTAPSQRLGEWIQLMWSELDSSGFRASLLRPPGADEPRDLFLLLPMLSHMDVHMDLEEALHLARRTTAADPAASARGARFLGPSKVVRGGWVSWRAAAMGAEHAPGDVRPLTPSTCRRRVHRRLC